MIRRTAKAQKVRLPQRFDKTGQVGSNLNRLATNGQATSLAKPFHFARSHSKPDIQHPPHVQAQAVLFFSLSLVCAVLGSFMPPNSRVQPSGEVPEMRNSRSSRGNSGKASPMCAPHVKYAIAPSRSTTTQYFLPVTAHRPDSRRR